MSHYTVMETRLKDVDALVEALSDMGYDELEVYDKPRPLVEFVGGEPNQRANVIIRKQYVGRLSNDIGFRLGSDGRFEAIISDYDQDRHNDRWMAELTKRYAYHATRTKLEEQGFTLTHEQRDNQGRVHLLLQRAG